MKATTALVVLAATLAGCAAPAAPPVEPAEAGPAAAPEGLAAAETPAPFALHLQPDLTLAPDPPASAGSVALATPVNGPFTPGYPAWNGTLPRGVDLTAAGLAVTFYVEAQTVSVRANALPMFADLPGFFVALSVGGRSLSGQAEGPQVLVAGEVAEVTATVAGGIGPVAADAAVRLELIPIYTHATQAAEFRFVMGPEQPARIDFG